MFSKERQPNYSKTFKQVNANGRKCRTTNTRIQPAISPPFDRGSHLYTLNNPSRILPDWIVFYKYSCYVFDKNKSSWLLKWKLLLFDWEKNVSLSEKGLEIFIWSYCKVQLECSCKWLFWNTKTFYCRFHYNFVRPKRWKKHHIIILSFVYILTIKIFE